MCAGSLRRRDDSRGRGSGGVSGVRSGCDIGLRRWSGVCGRCGGSRGGGSGGRSAVFGDHVQFGDGKAVISSGGTRPTCSVPGEGYVMAQMWLEINTAGGDLENVAGVVFRNCVVTIRATQATLNVGLVCID